MKIEVQRLNQAYHFEAVNEDGARSHIDADPGIGGENQGLRPMQLLLAGLAGCSAIDIGLILHKQRLTIDDLHITVEADRQQDRVPALFERIHIHYSLQGDLPPAQVGRAVALSLDKYCSVAHILRATAPITYTYAVNDITYGPDAAP
ncbi:MAG: OsmC family protein [Bacteroidia bacterium]